MKHVTQFIEDAIKGGWLPELWRSGNLIEDKEHIRENVFDEYEPTPPAVILLDPLAWQCAKFTEDDMIMFIKSVWAGSSIEESLSKIYANRSLSTN